eukprot:364217-Chlamydomonas_euryale.AAC.3
MLSARASRRRGTAASAAAGEAQLARCAARAHAPRISPATEGTARSTPPPAPAWCCCCCYLFSQHFPPHLQLQSTTPVCRTAAQLPTGMTQQMEEGRGGGVLIDNLCMNSCVRNCCAPVQTGAQQLLMHRSKA